MVNTHNVPTMLRTAAFCCAALLARPGLVAGDTTAAPVPAPEAKAAAPAPEKPKTSILLKVFAEWSYDFTENVDKESGFDLTRAYIGAKHEFADNLSGNVTLDVAGRSNEVVTAVYDTTKRTVKVTTDTKYKAFLKTAGLKWGLAPMTTVEAGLVGTNLFSTQEKFWGYRYVYKSFMDQNGFGSSADLGAKVTVQPLEILGIKAEILNGEGYAKPQDANGYYKVSGSADLKLPMGLSATAYYDYAPLRDPKEAQSVIASFIGYEKKGLFRVGAEYEYLMAKNGVDTANLSGLSGYAAYIVNKKIEIFARYDILQSENDWNLAADGQAMVAGLHYSPVKGVNLAADYQGFISADDKLDPVPKFKLNLEYSL